MINNTVNIFLIIFFGIGISNSIAQESNSINDLERALLTEMDPHKKMDVMIELTDLIIKSDPDRAFVLANQTVSLAIENDNPQSKVAAWIQIGRIYQEQNNFRKSIEMGIIKEEPQPPASPQFVHSSRTRQSFLAAHQIQNPKPDRRDGEHS